MVWKEINIYLRLKFEDEIYVEFCAIRYKYKCSIKRNAIFGRGLTQLGFCTSMRDFKSTGT